MKFYNAFYKQNLPIDFVAEKDDFNKYKLILAPLQFLVDDKMVEKFTKYVMQGGTLIFTMRSGVKEMNNQCHIEKDLPGKLTELVGATIREYDCLRDMDMGIRYKDKDYRSEIWCDVLEPNTATSLVKYTEDYYSDQSCVTVNNLGKGQVYYIGTEPEQKFIDDFFGDIIEDLGIQGLSTNNNEIELVRRRTKNEDYIFALNHSAKEKTIEVDDDWERLINNEKLEPYGYALFKVERGQSIS